MNTLQMIKRSPVIFKKLVGIKLNPFELLKADHMKVEALFLRLRSLGKKDAELRSRLIEEIRTSLEEHMALEEKIFYPECLKHDELRPLALESVEEHRQVRTLLKDLQKLPANDERADAKLAVMMEDVRHHVEEEESEFFPMVDKCLDQKTLNRLAGDLRRRRDRRRAAGPRAA